MPKAADVKPPDPIFVVVFEDGSVTSFTELEAAKEFRKRLRAMRTVLVAYSARAPRKEHNE